MGRRPEPLSITVPFGIVTCRSRNPSHVARATQARRVAGASYFARQSSLVCPWLNAHDARASALTYHVRPNFGLVARDRESAAPARTRAAVQPHRRQPLVQRRLLSTRAVTRSIASTLAGSPARRRAPSRRTRRQRPSSTASLRRQTVRNARHRPLTIMYAASPTSPSRRDELTLFERVAAAGAAHPQKPRTAFCRSTTLW